MSADIIRMMFNEISALKKRIERLESNETPTGGGADPNAIHDNVAGEIAAIANKATPIAADMLVIEDSADANNKKMIEIGDLPAGGGGAPDDAEYITAALNGTLSNEVAIPGLAGCPDRLPASAQAEDDEFDSNSLAGKWTKVSNAAADDVDTTWPSHVYANFTGDQYINLSQAYAPAGAFSLTVKFSYATQSNYQQGNLTAYDNDESDAVMAGYGINAGYMHTKDGGGWNYNRMALTLPMHNPFYVHLQRDGSNNWSVWVSFDGLSFWRCGTTYNKSLTVHHFIVSVVQAGATTPTRGGIDWVRRDWVTL